MRRKDGGEYHLTLEEYVTAFPMPTADACIGSTPTPKMAERFRKKNRSGSFVEAMAATMFPTPSASGMPCEGTVRLARKLWQEGAATLEEANAIAGRDVRDAQGKVPAMWPTPNAGNAPNSVALRCSGDGREKPNKLGWAVAEAEQDKVAAGGVLNPTWVEWLMGFPLGWTDCDA